MTNKLITKLDFLNMKDIKMLSESCVIVDKNFLGQLPFGTLNIQFNNPFVNLANEHSIRAACKVKATTISPFQGQIQANVDLRDEDNILYQYTLFPPKFLIQNITNDKNSCKARTNMSKLITHNDLFDEIGAIGVNYDFYIDCQTNENIANNLKNKILNAKISDKCSAFAITLKFKMDDQSNLNLTINEDVKLANVDNNVTLFNANIHTLIDINKSIDLINDVFNKESSFYINFISEKINTLLAL